MNNDIINLLNIEDKDVIITNTSIEGNIKKIYIEKFLKVEYCPNCSSRMHSKGKYLRHINHPILQDGYQLELIVSQRKWRCTNPQCNLYFNDQFNFISAYKQSSNMVPYMILNEMKNINITTSEVAERYNVSDTTVHYIFLQYLDIQRLPLPEILSIDEVHLDIDYKHKYTLIMMDFETNDIIDILPNRWDETTTSYFLSIPLEEREKVKYLICDMYKAYINYTKRYFPNSVAIIDSFHVVSWLIHKIIIYLNTLKKDFIKRDKDAFEEKLMKQNKVFDSNYINDNLPVSNEVYLLDHYRWLLLQNKDNIDYKIDRKYNYKFKMYLNTYDYEKMFFEVDESLIRIRELKEKYIEFNSTDERDKEKIAQDLSKLIEEYSESEFSLFREFAETLTRYKQEIINSFTYIKDKDGNERRLSNGPIEGFNRVPKDFKRNSRGLSNFDYARARLIWANRKNEPILAAPKSKSEVYKFKNKK